MKYILLLTVLTISIALAKTDETFVNASGMVESTLSAQPKSSIDDLTLGIPMRPVSEAAGYRVYGPNIDNKTAITHSPEILDAIRARATGQTYTKNQNAQDRPETDKDRKIAVQTDSGSYGTRSENLQFSRIRDGSNYAEVPFRPFGAAVGTYRN